MEKIPTIYERVQNTVINKLRPECLWIFDHGVVATEKLDGTNVRLTIRCGEIVRTEKRRNPTRVQKSKGIIDPWYTDVDPLDKSDKWIISAAHSTNTSDWPDGEHSCEAIGPKIQGNPLGLTGHACVPFNLETEIPVYDISQLTVLGIGPVFDRMRDLLLSLDSKYSPGHLAEGIVFHHPDGRRAKIKRKDF